MDIDNNTGLPKGMPNCTPLMDRLRAVTEGAEMALQAKVPLNGIETLLSKPETARKLLA